MRQVILIPGVMGSRLALGQEEVWPPTPKEVLFGYKRLAKLVDPMLQPTDAIRSVSCYTIYASLIDRLAAWGYAEYPAAGARGQLRVWPYDWRRDNRESARKLVDFLKDVVMAQQADPITLVAHSMGGLISRYALEADDAQVTGSWRSRVSLLVTMGTPHRGAPLALVRAAGLDGALGLSPADVKALAADVRYPSAYQLLPPTNARALWNRFAGTQPVDPVDLFDPGIAGSLGLAAPNLQAATQFHSALSTDRRPAGCRYFCFAGRQEQTIVRTELLSPVLVGSIRDADAGDGTVPSWSSALPGEQFQLDGGEHGTTFKNRHLLETLGQLLDVPQMLVAAAAAEAPAIRCVMRALILNAGEPTIVRVELAGALQGSLALRVYALDKHGGPVGEPVGSWSQRIEGASDKPALAIVAPARPGTYACVANFVSDGGAALQSGPEPFVVPAP